MVGGNIFFMVVIACTDLSHFCIEAQFLELFDIKLPANFRTLTHSYFTVVSEVVSADFAKRNIWRTDG